MKNKNKTTNGFGNFQAKQIRKMVVKPLTQLITEKTNGLHKVCRESFEEIQKVEQMIEIIARQMGRDLLENQ
jgi:hypothetical protein